jgi:phosphatidylserine/phosphatidylglycerophosphate/cardiolipin synthase-like enzyme
LDLIVQPDEGAKPILATINEAKKTLDLIIFRFDVKEMEKALAAAVARGVVVRTLIAHTNKGGEGRLRELELRMLDKGISVSRTGSDYARYHAKVMIVDREALHVHGFNFTAIDFKSRSFGIVTRDRRIVMEAVRLFEADAQRQEYELTREGLIVSPDNAREELATYIKSAKKSLSIYDPKLTDTHMLRLINERIKKGVDVRVLGKVGKHAKELKVQKLPGLRLHTRTIIRDNESVFVGSQSLRALELDARREVGLISKDSAVVKRIVEIFEEDWAKTDLGKKEQKQFEKATKQAQAEDVVLEITHS